MALTLPLHFFDGVCRCCGIPRQSTSTLAASEQNRLADYIVANASLFDVIRWRRTSKSFRRAADRRLERFTRIDVRMYNGLAELHGHSCHRDLYEWHPHAMVMMVEMGQNELGIAVDTKLRLEDVKALIQLLSSFRLGVQQLYMDSPIIELLVSQINRQQVNILLDLLRNSRTSSASSSPHKAAYGTKRMNAESEAVMMINQPGGLPYRPFFPQLKKLTITSKSNQLEHLSRLLTYAVGVDFLYETSNIDLLCLKIVMGNTTQWTHKPHMRMFRHVTSFRQWSEADSLGERYFQQFSGDRRKKQLINAVAQQ